MRRSTATASAILCAMLLAAPATARNTTLDFSVQEARDSELGQEKLLDVPFFMAGQKHGAVTKDFGVFNANRPTNAFGKADEEACRVAFLSAIIALQQRAKELGGNAVVDVKSITNHDDLSSATQYRCAAGNVVAKVALTGRVVTIK